MNLLHFILLKNVMWSYEAITCSCIHNKFQISWMKYDFFMIFPTFESLFSSSAV